MPTLSAPAPHAPSRRVSRLMVAAVLLAALAAVALSPVARAQPARPVTRTYVPPDQLVSFQPTVPLDQFLATLDPVFRRVTGRGVGRARPFAWAKTCEMRATQSLQMWVTPFSAATRCRTSAWVRPQKLQRAWAT